MLNPINITLKTDTMESTNRIVHVHCPSRALANEFAKSWTRATLRGHVIDGNTVTVYDVTDRDQQFIDGYIMVENDMLDPNGII